MNHILLKAALAAALFLLPSASPAAENVKILSGPTSGVWYVGMGAVGKAISALYPDIRINLLPGGGLSNPIRLQKGEGDISIATHSIAVSAARGLVPFKGRVEGVSSFFNIMDVSRMHIVSCSDRNYTSLREIGEKKLPVRLAVGPIGSGTEVWARWMLDMYGYSYKDIASWGGKVITNNWDDVANMIKDGQVDVITWLGPGEVGFLVELSKDVGMSWISVDEDVLTKMEERYGVKRHVIPASMYEGRVGEGVISIADSAELLVRSDLPDDLVYRITKAVSERKGDIAIANAGWATLDPAKGWQDLAFPLHPGAARYFREAGFMLQPSAAPSKE